MATKKTAAAAVEMVDIVDKDDKIIGQMERWEALEKGKRVRAVQVLLVNKAGEILVQWRKSTKKLSPRMFTSSATGAVLAGESYLQAADRELMEEMAVKAKMELIGQYRISTGNMANGEVFVAKWDGEVSGWEEEADGIDYWSPEIANFMLQRFPYLLTRGFTQSLKMFLKVK